MLVNSTYEPGHVEFVSYDGKYPCLCSGTLHIKVNGKSYFFGPHKPLGTFWNTGGECGWRKKWEDPYTIRKEWEINVEELPEELRPYAAEIDEVFNDNVEWGCCGGCH